MRDASILLLLLILSSMLLDYGYSRGYARSGPAAAARGLLMASAQGLAVGLVMYAFDRQLLAAIGAGAAFGLIWVVIRWVTGRWASAYAFVLQCLLQMLAMTVIWLSAEGYWSWAWALTKELCSAHTLLIVLAYVLVLRPASALIGAVLAPWLPSVNSEGSLKRAGTLIGYLERTLILTFVLLQQWEGIGFLLTAKSILRFNDIKSAEQRSLSEYVLLGTLVSFTVSIAIGLAALKLSGK